MFSSDADAESLTHRLVLPRDTNHYGTLYAGAVLSLALEAAYVAAFRLVGSDANLVLKRVLDLRCYEPVPVGTVVEIRSRAVHRARAHLVVAVFGSPLRPDRTGPWLDGALQFVQVGPSGRPEPLADESKVIPGILPPPWDDLRERVHTLLRVRG